MDRARGLLSVLINIHISLVAIRRKKKQFKHQR